MSGTETPRLRHFLKPGRYPWSDAYNETDLHQDRCIVCGKMTKSANRIMVALTGGGDYLVRPEDDADNENDPGYMGWWAIGSECGKDIPTEYRLIGVES